MDEAARARAAARRTDPRWQIVRCSLGTPPACNVRDETTVDERLAMMWPLAREAWSVAGLPIPDYERASTPGVLRRR